MSVPLIGIPTNYITFNSHFSYTYHGVNESMLTPLVDLLGFQPVILPPFGEPLAHSRLIGQLDGILLTAANPNIHPSQYGQEVEGTHQKFDPKRDALTLPLVRHAVSQAIPLLGICRGMQEINVAYGGSMIQCLHTRDAKYAEHRGWVLSRDADVIHKHDAHGIKVQPGGVLAGLLGDTQHVMVNSLHEQGIDRLGDGLRAEAISDDGIIEAISVVDAPAFAFGVQWHPEWSYDKVPVSKVIFNAFGQAVRERHARRG